MLGQDRGGDGPNPAGHGCNSPRGPDGALEVHISLESALRAHVDPHVQHHLSRGQKAGVHQSALAGGCHQDLRLPAHRRQVGPFWSGTMVTVAFRLCNSIDTGLPITRLRPMTAARLPAGSQP